MLLGRPALEACLLGATSLKAAAALEQQGESVLAVCVLLLTVFAGATENTCGNRKVLREHSRAAESEGLALGTLMLPWLMGAMRTAGPVGHAHGGDVTAAVYATLASSATLLTTMHWQTPAEDRQVPESPAAKTKAAAPTSTWLHLGMQACGAFFALAVMVSQLMTSRYSMQPVLNSLIMACLAPVLGWGLLQAVPSCLTVGEACLISQTLVLLGWRMVLSLPALLILLPDMLMGELGSQPEHVVLVVKYVVSVALAAAASAGRSMWHLGQAAASPPAVALPRSHAVIAGSTACAGILAGLPPAMWAVRFALSTGKRALMTGYWSALLALALPLIHRCAAAAGLPKTVVRKLYHLLAAAIFLPGLVFAEPGLVAVAAAAVFAVLVVLELLRVGRVPPLGEALQGFMVQFTDERDAGPLLMSHFSLLLGMSVPLWLALGRVEGREELLCGPGPAAGMLALGFLDTAASVVGTTAGRLPIYTGAKKTLEGLVGGVACTFAACAFLPLRHCGHGNAAIWIDASSSRLMLATLATGLLEAVTTQMDNFFLPLYYYMMLLLPPF